MAPRLIMSASTRDAFARVFERPGRVVVERDEHGIWWAGAQGRREGLIHCSGASPTEAIARLLAEPDLSNLPLLVEAR